MTILMYIQLAGIALMLIASGFSVRATRRMRRAEQSFYRAEATYNRVVETYYSRNLEGPS